MQAAHPEREGEIARAHALIMQGFVADQGDGTAKVLASDGQRHYTVNGTCDCQGAHNGKACKHRAAWLLYQHVQKKLAGQEQLPAAPLPEAPASVNLKVVIGGHEVQVTLRDHDETRLLTRLQTLLKRADIRPMPKPQPWSGGWKKGR